MTALRRALIQPPRRLGWCPQTALGPRPRRVLQRPWEEAQVEVLALGTPPRRAPHQGANGKTACGPDPVNNRMKMFPRGAALPVKPSLRTARSPPQSLVPSATPRKYRALGHRSATTGVRRDLSLIYPWVISPEEGSATISWPRGNLVPHICYLYGRKAPLACVPTIRGPRLPERKLSVLPNGSPVFPSSPSAKDGITPETLLVMNPIQRASIILVTLCLCLTRRPDQNKAVAPYILIVESDKIRVISICCCPQCVRGPDVPAGDLSCRVFRCPQGESPPLAWKGNHPCLGGLLIVGTRAAPSSERFTGAPLAPRLNRPPAVLGTGVSIFPRGVDTPRVPEVKRKSPTRRIRRFRAAKSEGGLPVRRLGPLCTAASGDGMIPVGRPLSVIPRAFPSIGGAAVSVRIPLCEHGLAKNRSWISGTTGVVPVRKDDSTRYSRGNRIEGSGPH